MAALLKPNKQKPSEYPALPFHLIRLTQLISSLIVASVLIFFVDQLHRSSFYIPWTFLLLLTVSLLSILAFLFTSFLHHTSTLPPRLSLLINTPLTILWLLSLALLTWNLSWTLGHRCITTHWHNDDGVMVCRFYKALTAFSVTGTFSTILALLLDVHVQRKSRARGKYNQMLDIKAPTNVRSSSPFHDAVGAEHGGHDVQRPYRTQRTFQAEQFGYSQPEEQTTYGGGGGGDLGFETGRAHAW